MSQDVSDWCRACRSCQQAKPGSGRGKTPYRIETVGSPMKRVGIDLKGPMPLTANMNRYILVIQDYQSRFIELFAIPDKQAETVADVLVKEYFTRYGVCERLHSDQGSEFNSHLTKEICRLWGVKKTRTSPFAPWSNGMVERSNRTLGMILRQFTDRPDYRVRWDEYLPFARLAMNATVNRTTGCTPSLLFFSRGEEMLLPVELLTGTTAVHEHVACLPEYVMEQKLVVQEIMEMARQVTERSVDRTINDRLRGNLKIRDYKVGDYVWRYYPPHATDKLHYSPWTGPWEVEDVDNDHHTVKLRVPKVGGGFELKWIHVSNLKPIHTTKDDHLLLSCEVVVQEYLRDQSRKHA